LSSSLDRLLPPFDLHAHVDATVTRAQLATLRPALIFAVTRTLDEAAAVSTRSDIGVLWGCGVHPGLAEQLQAFDRRRFESVAASFSFVGEIGLDRKVSATLGRQVLEGIVTALDGRQVIASLHSTGMIHAVLEVIGADLAAPVLHWFTGTARQIEQAASAGAYFSVNAAMSDEQLARIPRGRALPETDFPFTKRAGSKAPGDIGRLEDRVGHLWGIELEGVRRTWYENFRALCRQAGVLDELPEEFLIPTLSV